MAKEGKTTRRYGLAGLTIVMGLLLSFAQLAWAQTPEPSPATDASPTPSPVVTPAPSLDATPAVDPGTSVPVVIAGRLVEDLNDNGQLDDADGPATRQTLVQLVPWSRQPEGIQPFAPPTVLPDEADVAEQEGPTLDLLTTEDGTFSFTNVPPGDYTLRVWWSAGFVSGGSPQFVTCTRSYSGSTQMAGSCLQAFPRVNGAACWVPPLTAKPM